MYPAAAGPSSAVEAGTVGTECASRCGTDIRDQADKVMGYSENDTGEPKTGLPSALCINSHGLADMTTKVGLEIVIHRFAETPFMKVDNICILQFRYIIWEFLSICYRTDSMKIYIHIEILKSSGFLFNFHVIGTECPVKKLNAKLRQGRTCIRF